MKHLTRCPDCGSTDIGQGIFKGYASLMPVENFFSFGSPVVADVCSNCGLILRLRVVKPHKFKSNCSDFEQLEPAD
ncbi:transcription initiation factor TFIIIB [Heliobacillus mobilis]|uniref:Transcription initiation factor TFIIIB n=1 Tax=Heliobacterium mobile TaxID=28064 RepID=A0A6I3SC09_HELMO|nr:transcription initiation factor TFIIIB [Heliobacterium mobile]MTV47469.1 transcription initiation factor TFIIIB [Heliobacterium mobile]